MVSKRLRQSPLYGILAAQFTVTGFVSVACLMFDPLAAMSAILAGLVCLIPGGFVLAMSHREVVSGSSGLANVVRGEVGRFTLSVLMFALVFAFVEQLEAVAFFATFILLQLCTVMVPWQDARRKKGQDARRKSKQDARRKSKQDARQSGAPKRQVEETNSWK